MKEPRHIHISSDEKRLSLNFKEVAMYRDLIWLLTKKDFSLRFKQTILGPAWVVLTPFISSLIYCVVFGGIAGIPTDGVPKILFYLLSTAVWTLFANNLTQNSSTFTRNAHIFGKVYFPRLVVPISTALSGLIQFAAQLSPALLFWAYYCCTGVVSPDWTAFALVPFALLHLCTLGIGVGIIVSSLTTKYRDLAMLVGFGVQLWMFATPVVYPLSQTGSGWIHKAIEINPVTAPVEVIRHAFLGVGAVEWNYIALSWAITIVIFILGVLLFNKVEKNFMDTV